MTTTNGRSEDGPESCRLALGLKLQLKSFAAAHRALTWKQLARDDAENWRYYVLVALDDPGWVIFFNLLRVEVEAGLLRAASNRGSSTDWELLMIQQNPEWWPRIRWFEGETPAPNPFDLAERGFVMEFRSDRRFQVWDYHVSHARLLIRSPISPDTPTNHDIIFIDVDFLNIPTSFLGLSLATVPLEEAIRAGLPADMSGDSTAFRLESEGRCSYLIAFACRVLENELDLMDSSLQEPWEARPREDLGRVLARS